jgi:hypothetical protein
MEKPLDEVEEHGHKQLAGADRRVPVPEAPQQKRTVSTAAAPSKSIEEMLDDPAIARWMPPYKYRSSLQDR